MAQKRTRADSQHPSQLSGSQLPLSLDPGHLMISSGSSGAHTRLQEQS